MKEVVIVEKEILRVDSYETQDQKAVFFSPSSPRVIPLSVPTGLLPGQWFRK